MWKKHWNLIDISITQWLLYRFETIILEVVYGYTNVADSAWGDKGYVSANHFYSKVLPR